MRELNPATWLRGVSVCRALLRPPERMTEACQVTANFFDALRAGFVPNRPCFVSPEGSVTYGELEGAADVIANRLRADGVRPGDRVAVISHKRWEVVAAYLGALKAGGVFVPINPSCTAHELSYFLEDARPASFIRDARAFLDACTAPSAREPAERRAASDAASLIYTSGTTGRPKGAILTHGGLRANGEALARAWGFTDADVLLHALPIFHVHGLFIALHCALLSGCSMIWRERFAEDEVIADLSRATVLMGVPTFYTRLLARRDFSQEGSSKVRLFVSGSAPLLQSTFEAFEARTGKRILERYGMSEALVITTNPLQGERLAGSVGYALEGMEVRIAGGEIGEIQIRGESVFAGYWEQPEKTAEAFTPDGFFRTGDVGRMDADGRLWISGREKDLIITGGFNVYPKEIELILDELPGVAESAVVGLPHPDFGEAVTAVLRGEGDEAAVIAALRQRLASYKIPKRVLFVDELPRNAMGKVQKNLLRTQFAETYT